MEVITCVFSFQSIGQFDMSDLCFQYVVEIQPDIGANKEMQQAVVCEKHYMEALKDQHR